MESMGVVCFKLEDHLDGLILMKEDLSRRFNFVVGLDRVSRLKANMAQYRVGSQIKRPLE